MSLKPNQTRAMKTETEIWDVVLKDAGSFDNFPAHVRALLRKAVYVAYLVGAEDGIRYFSVSVDKVLDDIREE